MTSNANPIAPMRRRLIVFTRYPQPGNTKTRLIPALGCEGAAALQDDLTRHVLRQARELRELGGMEVEVRFEGGDVQRMAAAFGSDLCYRPQDAGDLGCRMEHAFDDAFADGAQHVIIIGADCPGITTNLLVGALNRLLNNDLVLGPAADGGYYLIGLTRREPALFHSMIWGVNSVFAETIRRAESRALQTGTLETLSDVDLPQDLPVWRRVQAESSKLETTTGLLSVIIPAVNEERHLPVTLESLRAEPDVEVIVVDGGSDDTTSILAQEAGHKAIQSPRGRATQMNVGAAVATGETLLFLHADTRLPPHFSGAVRETLSDPRVVAGAFQWKVDDRRWKFRVLESLVNFRSRRLQLPYGDQAIFLHAQTFWQLGGFLDLPLLEDFDLIRALRRRGRIKTARAAAITSARRWQKLGIMRTTWINQKIILGRLLGVSPDTLANWYRAPAQATRDKEAGHP